MNYFRKNSPWILAIFFLLILIFSSYEYLEYKRDQWEKDIRNQALELLISKKSSIEKSLFSRIYYTRGVAAFVSLKPNITNDEYKRLAHEFIQNDTVISSMALSKNCIINAIYPLEGHEQAIGLNLMEHKERREIVQQTIATRKTFVAGPVELVEGGEAFISYTPIFDTTQEEEGVFWGMTDIVIYKDRLIREAALLEQENNFLYALRGENGSGEKGEVFWGNKQIFTQSPVTIRIELPTGYWLLAAVPLNGWAAYYDQDKVLSTVLILSSLIISLLMFFVLHGINRIRNSESEFKAILSSMDTLIIEFNSEGEYFKVIPTNVDLLVLPEKELMGRKLTDVFEPELTHKFMDAIAKCIATKKVVVIDYPLQVKGKDMWFTARISYKSKNTVIFNIYDTTKLKEAEAELKASESSLKELNELKNKFFSLIAHDLRNPIGSFRNLTELMLNDDIAQSETEKRKLIRSIHDTSVGLSDLLENLISWAMSQQKTITIFPVLKHIAPICADIVDTQITHALVKKIQFVNTIEANQTAFFDVEMTTIILRNLISNAIKYSHPNSVITLSSSVDSEQLHVHIADSGVGIPANKIEHLFEMNKNIITNGTNNEKGSGLGLILCKDFAELQKGTISVVSEEGKGSIFTLSLPLHPVS